MIGYDVDIWIAIQTLMRANLSVIEQPLDGSVMREQFDGPKASIDRPWSVPSLLLGLGHPGHSLYLVALRSRQKLRVPMKSVNITALVGTSIAWAN